MQRGGGGLHNGRKKDGDGNIDLASQLKLYMKKHIRIYTVKPKEKVYVHDKKR